MKRSSLAAAARILHHFKPDYSKLSAYIRSLFPPNQAAQALERYFLDAIVQELQKRQLR
jgi:hypothetical protein